MPDRRDLRRELTRDLSSPEVVNSRQATELYEPITTEQHALFGDIYLHQS